MRLSDTLLSYSRPVMTVVALLTLLGAFAWKGMDRQEDPFFPYRYGDVLVPYPGADPEQVERLVLDPLEEELAQVEQIDELQGAARLGFAHLIIVLKQNIYDTDAAWDRIRLAVDKAAARFPRAAGAARIDDRQMDTHAVVLALTGSDDLIVLRAAAKRLRRDLFQLKGIDRIDLLGDPGEQISIGWDDAVARKTGLSAAALGAQIAARNSNVPAGSLKVAGRSLVLDPVTELRTLDELAATPIRTADGALIPLSELAAVRHMALDPRTERIGVDGRPAVALGIVIPSEGINAVAFGEGLRAHLRKLHPEYAPLEIRELFYQPRWVEKRLGELGQSLLLGVAVLAAVLFLAMGARLGLTVVLIVPVVTLSAVAVYALGGGVMHQIAIAGMIIALGMLVDNAIVMAENIQWHRDRGLEPARAAAQSVSELAAPLLAATGTTLAGFAPLLLASGDTADFTRAIPVTVMLTLTVSLLYALVVTPVLASAILKPRAATADKRAVRQGERVVRAAVRHPILVISIAGALVLGAGAMFGALDRDFFPSTDRNQLLIDLKFPEGTHPDRTEHGAAVLAADLAGRTGVENVYRFSGFSGPRFYYNLPNQPQQPHLARLVVVTDGVERLVELMEWVRAHTHERLPEATVIVRRLGQGPPVEAPVEIRVFGDEPAALGQAARMVLEVVRADPATRDARHQLGDGLPSLEVRVDDGRAADYGLTRQDVAEALTVASHGLQISTWRAGRDPIPIHVRSPEGERFPTAALAGLTLSGDDGRIVPLGEIARIDTRWQPAIIQHRDLQRMTRVLSEVTQGQTHAHVLKRIEPKLQELALPEGTWYTIGGAAESDAEANGALLRMLPVGGLLLVLVLLLQFNSFRMVGIVLVTVPLAAVGVIPGLWLAGQPFSFTAILGIVALIGIVVNNAIVLIDLINRNRRQGVGPQTAIIDAVNRRARPILLTTATTVAGLFPLTFTQSTLWPPLAWAIISGLCASTLLTLIVIPALYRLLLAGAAEKGV